MCFRTAFHQAPSRFLASISTFTPLLVSVLPASTFAPSDTPTGFSSSHPLPAHFPLLTTRFLPPLYGLSPWLPTPGPPCCSSICASFLIPRPRLAPVSPLPPFSIRPHLFPQPALHSHHPSGHAALPRPRPLSPGPAFLPHFALAAPVSSSTWPTPLPSISHPRSRLCPVQRLPPACSRSPGEQRAAASSLVAGLNEACRIGATTTTALRPRQAP